MKNLLLIASLLIATTAHAQTRVVKDAQGNYKAATDTAKATGRTFTDKQGKVYPVYESRTGRIYYSRTAKSGRIYRRYLKVN